MNHSVQTNERETIDRAVESKPRLLERDSREQLALGHVTVITRPENASRSQFRWQRLRAFAIRNKIILMFVFILIGLDVVFGEFASVWSKHSPDDYALRTAACALQPRDLVILGGSPVAEGVDPDVFRSITWRGKKLESIYSLGLSGGTTSDFYHALLRGCPTPPRFLIYGVTASDLNDSRNEPHGPYSLMNWGDLIRWVQLRPDSGEWVVRHFLLARLGQLSSIYRYRHGIRMWCVTESEKFAPGSCPDSIREADELREHANDLASGDGYAPARGYSVGRYDVAKIDRVAPKELPYLRKYRTGSHLRYLDEIVNWCERNRVELLLIDMPVTADLEAIYPSEFREFREKLEQVGRERGLRVVRASREDVGLCDAHFADLIHLNREGGKLFSFWLRDYLARNGKE